MSLNRFYNGIALICFRYECVVREIKTGKILKVGTYEECLEFFNERRN